MPCLCASTTVYCASASCCSSSATSHCIVVAEVDCTASPFVFMRLRWSSDEYCFHE